MKNVILSPITLKALEKMIKKAVKEAAKESSKTPAENETYLSQKEIAVMLEVTPQTLIKWRKSEGMPYHRTGRSPKYLESEVRQWMESRGNN